MLVTFHSPAAPDVTMLSDLAQYLLGIVGKRVGQRGVITSEELPAAISKLEAAMSADGAPIRVDDTPTKRFAASRAPSFIVLSRRAYPLLDMMHAARQRHAAILWEV